MLLLQRTPHPSPSIFPYSSFSFSIVPNNLFYFPWPVFFPTSSSFSSVSPSFSGTCDACCSLLWPPALGVGASPLLAGLSDKVACYYLWYHLCCRATIDVVLFATFVPEINCQIEFNSVTCFATLSSKALSVIRRDPSGRPRLHVQKIVHARFGHCNTISTDDRVHSIKNDWNVANYF